MDIEHVGKVLKSLGEPGFRLTQVAKAVYGDGISSYEEATVLPAALRKALSKRAPLLSLKRKRLAVSSDRRAHKALLTLSDGKIMESVLLRPKPGGPWSACISSQVGCAIGCSFCATGRMGLRRSLTPEEIADQVLFWRQYLRAEKLAGELTNVVYMGMGEPLHALDPVFASLRILLDAKRLALSARKVSVSTAGLIPGMESFVAEFPQVNLALSLHSAIDVIRTKLVPINKTYPLAELRRVLRKILTLTRRKIFLEYVLLRGENDSIRDARELSRFIHKVGRADLLHVNLIVWNPTDTPHHRPAPEEARAFRDHLRRFGVHVTIRKSLGADIRGACGQLASA